MSVWEPFWYAFAVFRITSIIYWVSLFSGQAAIWSTQRLSADKPSGFFYNRVPVGSFVWFRKKSARQVFFMSLLVRKSRFFSTQNEEGIFSGQVRWDWEVGGGSGSPNPLTGEHKVSQYTQEVMRCTPNVLLELLSAVTQKSLNRHFSGHQRIWRWKRFAIEKNAS